MKRTRRLRTTENMRSLVRETYLHPSDFVYPIFVAEGQNIKNAVDSMPGIYQYSIDRMDEELERIWEAGIKSILIFVVRKSVDFIRIAHFC